MARPRGTEKHGMKYLNDDQLDRFFKAVRRARNIRDDLMFTLTLFLGLRVSELVSLRLGDLDIYACQIHIKAKKNGRSRTYNLEGALWEKMRRWLRHRKRQYGEDSPHLFPSPQNPAKALTDQTPKNLFKKYAKEAGLSADFSIHGLRHSCAIQRARAGDSPYRVMLWLRHKCISNTEIYFDRIRFEDDDRRAKEVFQQYM